MTAAFARASSRSSVGGAIKLARLLEMSEREFEARITQLEANPLFSRLVAEGAVKVQPYAARLASRKPDGRQLSMSSEGLSALLDGRSNQVELIQRMGQELFEENFLGDSAITDERRAAACGISIQEARALREFVDRAYIQAELQLPAAAVRAPEQFYSVVAGIEIDGGRPVITFFNRAIWKGRYRLDGGRLAALRQSLPFAAARRLDKLVSQVELMDRRKTTLYRVLEALLDQQARFFITRDPSALRALTQTAVAKHLDISPSVLNRLVSNKSIRLPWGLETPLSALMPSSKRLLLNRVDELVSSHPGYSDQRLREELACRFGAQLSRRSISQYRKDLGVAGLQTRRRSLAVRPSPETNIISLVPA